MNTDNTEQNHASGPSALSAGLERGLATEILLAARADHCIRLAQAKNAWDAAKCPETTPVAKAVQELRDAWYHDGEAEQVERCRKAINDLGTVLRSNA